MGNDVIFDLAAIDRMAELMRERGHAAIRDPARDDQIEVLEICRHIERKTVAGYPARNADTDGGQLLATDPHSGEALHAARVDPVLASRTNQHLFEIANVSMNILTIRFEINDRIANNLSGPVIRDVAAAAGLMHFDAARAQQLWCGQNVRTAAVAAHAQRQDMRVFNQQQRVINRAAHPIFDECALQGDRIAVGDASETPDD
jgi:hypothetical protein